MEEPDDEIVPFVKSLLEDHKAANDRKAFAVTWRYFLSEAHDFRNVLQDRLTRERWPDVYKSIDGERTLHLAIGGACPSSCLMGFLVWLTESHHYRCEISCSLTHVTADPDTRRVTSLLNECGWKIQLLSSEEHFTYLELDKEGLDVILIGHPKEQDDGWQGVVSHLRPNGCLLLLDFPDAASFRQVERLDGMKFADPVVMDRLPAGLEAFDESERSAVRSLALTDGDRESEFPVLESDSVATLFVNRIRRLDAMASSSAVSPTDSWAKSEGKRETRGDQRNGAFAEVPWKGSWRRSMNTGALPPDFTFASLEMLPAEDTADDVHTRAYYDSLRHREEISRIHLEGMGRPLLMQHYRKSRVARTLGFP